MTHEATTIEVTWDGPYGWSGFESDNNLRPIPQIPGVYLQTFEYQCEIFDLDGDSYRLKHRERILKNWANNF